MAKLFDTRNSLRRHSRSNRACAAHNIFHDETQAAVQTGPLFILPGMTAGGFAGIADSGPSVEILDRDFGIVSTQAESDDQSIPCAIVWMEFVLSVSDIGGWLP